MSDPTAQQPTEEELQEYFAQMREVPFQEMLMEAISVLATGANVKVGLPEARPLIDAMDAVVNIATPHLGEAAEQVAQTVAQLKAYQVQAEKQMAAQAEGDAEGGAAQGEQASGSAPSAPSAPPSAPAQPEQKATDKLWIPGRDG